MANVADTRAPGGFTGKEAQQKSKWNEEFQLEPASCGLVVVVVAVVVVARGWGWRGGGQSV